MTVAHPIDDLSPASLRCTIITKLYPIQEPLILNQRAFSRNTFCLRSLHSNIGTDNATRASLERMEEDPFHWVPAPTHSTEAGWPAGKIGVEATDTPATLGDSKVRLNNDTIIRYL